MIKIYYTKKKTPFVWASDLHKELEVRENLLSWFPTMINYGFKKNEDFYQKYRYDEGNLNQSLFDWAVQIDMAKHIAMDHQSKKGKAIRQHLIDLDKKHHDGLLLSRPQIIALIELCRALGLLSVQQFLEKEHYNIYNKPQKWWSRRAELFGYSAKDLRDAVSALGKKYKSQRQALMLLDKYELIRQSTMDLFISLGKSDEFARNIALTSKELAKEMRIEIYRDEGASIDFRTKGQIETIEKIKGGMKDKNHPNSLFDKF